MQFHITATRHGMSQQQRTRLTEIIDWLLENAEVKRAHHGDCVGGDAQFHDLVREKNIPITIHPPEKKHLCANKAEDQANGTHDIEVLDARDFMVRNENMVRAGDLTIACPRENRVRNHGGTWRTWAFARAVKSKAVILIYPNGAADLTDAGRLDEIFTDGRAAVARLRALLAAKVGAATAKREAGEPVVEAEVDLGLG